MLNSFINLFILCQEGTAEVTQASPWSSLIMIIAIIAIFYFLMIRPQQKKQKEIKKFREGLKTGDRVITAGGIHGKITTVKDETFTICIAPDVNIKVDKGSVYPAGTPSEEVTTKQ